MLGCFSGILLSLQRWTVRISKIIECVTLKTKDVYTLIHICICWFSCFVVICIVVSLNLSIACTRDFAIKDSFRF